MTMILAAALAAIALAGCGRTPPGERPPVDADDGLVGLLHHSVPGGCAKGAYCGPEFSLLNESLDEWAPLEGSLDPAHHGLVVAIDGKIKTTDERDREWFGEAAAPYAIDVRRYRLLSDIPYHDFLVEQASEFTTRKYGCDLLWDKTFRWQLVDGRVHLLVRMTDTQGQSAAASAPFLELTFDGVTGHFLAEDMQPWGVNPCNR